MRASFSVLDDSWSLWTVLQRQWVQARALLCISTSYLVFNALFLSAWLRLRQEAAAGALRNLTYNNNVNRNAMAAAGAVPAFVCVGLFFLK